jgi:tRNA(fMet)-specific endonuclease VapC
MTYVLDTNIISALLKGNQLAKDQIQNAILEGSEIFINAITYYEIKRGLLAANLKNKMKRFNLFCKRFSLLLLDSESIFDEAAEIYANLKKQGKLLEDADILIASAVKTRDFILVSNDTDFNRIQGLKMENWMC